MDQAVSAEVGGPLRGSRAGQIGGTGEDRGAHLPDLDRDQRRIRQGPDANRQVQALLHQADAAVEEKRLRAHQGIAVQEGGQNRGHMQASEQQGGGDAKLAARLRVIARR